MLNITFYKALKKKKVLIHSRAAAIPNRPCLRFFFVWLGRFRTAKYVCFSHHHFVGTLTNVAATLQLTSVCRASVQRLNNENRWNGPRVFFFVGEGGGGGAGV